MAVGEDLHVAGQDHEFDVIRVHQLKEPSLGFGLGLRRHGDVVERDPVPGREPFQVGVVGHHCRDLHREFAAAGAEQQVVEAVIVFATPSAGSAACGHGAPGASPCAIALPAARSWPATVRRQRCHLRYHLGGEVDPHEEVPRVPVTELLEVNDVALLLEQEIRN